MHDCSAKTGEATSCNCNDSAKEPSDERNPFEESNDWREEEIDSDDHQEPSANSQKLGNSCILIVKSLNQICERVLAFFYLVNHFLEHGLEAFIDTATDHAAAAAT